MCCRSIVQDSILAVDLKSFPARFDEGGTVHIEPQQNARESQKEDLLPRDSLALG